MRTKNEIGSREKALSGMGVLLTADESHFVIAVGYKFRARPFGEVAEWGGTLTAASEIPTDAVYTLELDEDLDGRAGMIKLESVKELDKPKFRFFEYTFKGTSPLM